MNICILCKSGEKDDIQYGEFLKSKTMGVHTFCLYLSSNLSQNGADDEGFLGFLEADIKQEVRRIALLNCAYCHKPYANIGCCRSKCRRTFHLICGLENKAENQFSRDFRSYCNKHTRNFQSRPTKTETCLICYDNLYPPNKQFNSITMIKAPCCLNGWFHKLCLQKFAKTSGYFFKCPLCNDVKIFREKLPLRGIFIPNQDAAWELEPNAFAELLERPSECSSSPCNNKQGREVSSTNNPFVLCNTCGSTAMHKQCLPQGSSRFNCADCTIAIEEADSGRESFNSQQNPTNYLEDEEEIDVCHVSDREDLAIVTALTGYTNRDSREKTRKKTLVKTRRIRSDTESTDGTEDENSKSREKPGVSTFTNNNNHKRIESDIESNTEEHNGNRAELCKKNRYNEENAAVSSCSTKMIETKKDKPEYEEQKSSNGQGHSTMAKTRRIRSDTESTDSTEDENSKSTNKKIFNNNHKRIETDIESNTGDHNANRAELCKKNTYNKENATSSSCSTKMIETKKEKQKSSNGQGHSTSKANQIKSDTESSSEEEGQNNLDCENVSSSSEDTVMKLRRKRSLNILSDSEDETTANKLKRIETKDTKTKPKNHNFSRISIDDDEVDDVDDDDDDEVIVISSNNNSFLSDDSEDDDDPLENFTKIMEKRKEISCIALRTRRKSQYFERPQDVETNSKNLKATRTKEIEINSRNEINAKENRKLNENLPSSSAQFKIPKSDTKAKTHNPKDQQSINIDENPRNSQQYKHLEDKTNFSVHNNKENKEHNLNENLPSSSAQFKIPKTDTNAKTQNHKVQRTRNIDEKPRNSQQYTHLEDDRNSRSKNIKENKTPKSSSYLKPLRDETNSSTRNQLDISCIAKRTRRKSMNCRPNIEQKENQNKTPASSLNISCIAVRTRRKTICAQTAKEMENMKPSWEMSQIYEKQHESEEDEETIEDELEDIAEADEEYTESEEEESDINDFIVEDDDVDDDYEENDNPFETSCIAKRTRRRSSKSLNPTLQQMDEEESSSSAVSYSSNSSSSGTSSASYSGTSSESNNTYLNKRCSRRIISSSSEELEQIHDHHTPKSKSTTTTSKMLLEKCPTHKNSPYLKSKYSTSKSLTHYRPHSNNHRRV